MKTLFTMALMMCQLSVGAQQETTFERLPDYPVKGGVSAPFAGMVGDMMVVLGGCNFPDKPAADGGTKKYYSDGHSLRLPDEMNTEWEALPELPFAVAYGASAETDKGLVCIGGMNDKGSLASVFRVERDAKGAFSFHKLPSLPSPIDNGSAAELDGCVYITGGNQPDGDKALYRLRPDVDTAWVRLADYTGAKRVQPTLLATSGRLFLAGGFQYTRDDNKCELATDMIEYDVVKNRWSYCSRLPLDENGKRRCLVGSCGVAVDGTLVFTGGVNHDIFKAAMQGQSGKDYMIHEPSWYRFNDDILLYNVDKQSWSVIHDIPCMARAGGVLLYCDKHIYMVCGEIKPGVRTQQVSKYHIGEIGR